jgi:hypothetical protein
LEDSRSTERGTLSGLGRAETSRIPRGLSPTNPLDKPTVPIIHIASPLQYHSHLLSMNTDNTESNATQAYVKYGPPREKVQLDKESSSAPPKKRAKMAEEAAASQLVTEAVLPEQDNAGTVLEVESDPNREEGSEEDDPNVEEAAQDFHETMNRMTRSLQEQSHQLEVIATSVGELVTLVGGLNSLMRQMGTTYAQTASGSLAYMGQLLDHHFTRLIQAMKGESTVVKPAEVVVEKVVPAGESRAAEKPKKAVAKAPGFTAASLLASEVKAGDLEQLAKDVEVTFPLNPICWRIDSNGVIRGAALSDGDQNPAGKVDMKAEVLGRHFHCVAAKEEVRGGWLKIRASQGLGERDAELITMLRKEDPDALRLCLTLAAVSPTDYDERCRAKITGNEGARELLFPPLGLLEPYGEDAIFLVLVRAVEEFGGILEAVRAVEETKEHKLQLLTAAEHAVEVGKELVKLLGDIHPVGLSYPSEEIDDLAVLWDEAEGVEVAGVAHFAMVELAKVPKGTSGTNTIARATYQGVKNFLGRQKDRYVPPALARDFLAPFVMASIQSLCDEIDKGEVEVAYPVKVMSTVVTWQILRDVKLRPLLVRFVAGRATQKSKALGQGTSAFVALANHLEKETFALLLAEAQHYALRMVTLSLGQGRGLLDTLEDVARIAAWLRFEKGYKGEEIEGLRGVGALPWLAVYKGPPVIGDYLQTSQGARGITWLSSPEGREPFIHGDATVEDFMGALPKESPPPRLYGEWTSYAELHQVLKDGVVRSAAEAKGEAVVAEEATTPPVPVFGFGQDQPQLTAQVSGDLKTPTFAFAPAQPK